MDDPAKTIAVVRGQSTADVEQTFRTLVDRWQPTVRLAGLIAESHGLADRACNAGFLRNIATAERFSIFQDLGPGSTVCHLDGAGALTAAGAMRRDSAAGCELVLLSKFGKLEAAGEGLAGAFKTALDARIPLVTSVSPALEDAWKRFTGRPFVILPADPIEIDAWWRPLGRWHPRLSRSSVAGSNAGDNIGRCGRTAERKPQSFPHDLSRHCHPRGAAWSGMIFGRAIIPLQLFVCA